jgi:hypothetical protein
MVYSSSTTIRSSRRVSCRDVNWWHACCLRWIRMSNTTPGQNECTYRTDGQSHGASEWHYSLRDQPLSFDLAALALSWIRRYRTLTRSIRPSCFTLGSVCKVLSSFEFSLLKTKMQRRVIFHLTGLGVHLQQTKSTVTKPITSPAVRNYN